MAQFEVYRLPQGLLVLNVQSDMVDTPTRMVAPLPPVTDDYRPMGTLEPVFQIEGAPHFMQTAYMVAVHSRFVMGEPVASLITEDYRIRRALDLLLSGI